MAGIFCCLNMNKIQKIASFWLKGAKIAVVVAVLALNMPIQEAAAAWTVNDIMTLLKPREEFNYFLITGQDSLMALNSPIAPKTMTVVLTAYSSTPDQTDSTPFTTASGTRVRDGIVASNFLAFGTKIKIPELFGDKEFVVEDRMARKHGDKIDIWFPERRLARRFGIQEAEVVILD